MTYVVVVRRQLMPREHEYCLVPPRADWHAAERDARAHEAEMGYYAYVEAVDREALRGVYCEACGGTGDAQPHAVAGFADGLCPRCKGSGNAVVAALAATPKP